MTDRPILFSGPMILAILAGKKTQTRRSVRNIGALEQRFGRIHVCDSRTGLSAACPYGVPGDLLWVRETFWVSGGAIVYRANEPALQVMWKPSIYMPHEISRITLEVIGVRVERLQDISDDDAKAEGIDCPSYPETVMNPYATYFPMVWDRINGKRAPWSTNPWIWRVEFRRLL